MAVKVTNRNIDTQSPAERPAIKVDNSTGTSFSEKVKETRTRLLSDDLDELARIVKERGKTFLKSPEEGLLKSYKESIKQFLKKVANEFLSLKEEFGASQDSEQKVFQLVNSVDSEVESLTKDTLSENRAVGLLASLDDIRGLVLDIMG
jgi:uncharacterized protein YaaR (DUF327 family)